MMQKRTAWTGLLLLIVAGLSDGGPGSGSEVTVWRKIRSQLPAGSDIRVRVLDEEVVEVRRPDGMRFVVDLADFGARIELELAAGRLAVLDVEHFPIVRQWYVAHRRGRTLPPVAERFARFVVERAGELAAGS